MSKISSESHDIICHQGPACGHLSDVHTDWCFLAMSSFSLLTCLFSCLDEIIVMRSVVLNDCRCHMRWDEVVLLTVCQINYDVFMYKWTQFAWFVFVSHRFIHEPHRWTWRQSVTGVVGVCNAIQLPTNFECNTWNLNWHMGLNSGPQNSPENVGG